MRTEEDNVLPVKLNGQCWSTGKLAKQECPWWGRWVRWGGQRRVGGALGGHYTDRSPQPLTNLDLALLARSSSPGEILEASLRPQSENTNTKTCFHFFHSGSSNDATLGNKGNKVLELLPLLSFHFISLPRTTRRAHLDLRLGPRVWQMHLGAFFPLSFSLFQAINHLGSVGWREWWWQRLGMPPSCQRSLSALKASS